MDIMLLNVFAVCYLVMSWVGPWMYLILLPLWGSEMPSLCFGGSVVEFERQMIMSGLIVLGTIFIVKYTDFIQAQKKQLCASHLIYLIIIFISPGLGSTMLTKYLDTCFCGRNEFIEGIVGMFALSTVSCAFGVLFVIQLLRLSLSSDNQEHKQAFFIQPVTRITGRPSTYTIQQPYLHTFQDEPSPVTPANPIKVRSVCSTPVKQPLSKEPSSEPSPMSPERQVEAGLDQAPLVPKKLSFEEVEEPVEEAD